MLCERDHELIEELVMRVSERVVELLGSGVVPSTAMVDAQTKAMQLGVSREFVYRHAAALGGVQVGGGERSRWRFPAEPPTQTPQAPAMAPRVRRRPPRSSVPLLPIRG